MKASTEALRDCLEIHGGKCYNPVTLGLELCNRADELQARLDATLALCDAPGFRDWGTTHVSVEAIRKAANGEIDE